MLSTILNKNMDHPIWISKVPLVNKFTIQIHSSPLVRDFDKIRFLQLQQLCLDFTHQFLDIFSFIQLLLSLQFLDQRMPL